VRPRHPLPSHIRAFLPPRQVALPGGREACGQLLNKVDVVELTLSELMDVNGQAIIRWYCQLPVLEFIKF
jgi:hypothetical protein